MTYELGLEGLKKVKLWSSSYGKYNQQIFESLLYRNKWNTNILGKVAGKFDNAKNNDFYFHPW